MSPTPLLSYTTDEPTASAVLDDDVVEIPLLLSSRQVASLEKQAFRQGLTAGELLRHLVNDFLAQSQSPCRRR